MVNLLRKKMVFLPLGLLALAGLAYLWALSTLGFRSWMAEWNVQRGSYPSAIHWYTRALRLEDPATEPQRHQAILLKLYRAYESICNWEFDGNTVLGWFAGDQVEALELGQGVLAMRAWGNDAALELGRFRLAPARAYQFAFRLRCRSGTQARLFWAAAADVYPPGNQLATPISANAQWEEHLLAIPPQADGLGKFRFLPCNAPGLIELDWIRITPLN